MRITSLLCLSLALLTVLCPATAARAAAPVDAAGAAHLETVLTGYLDYQKSFVALKGRGALQLDGPISVEPQESYYAVTMPHASIRYPDGSHFEIGIISINAAPHDAPGRWKVSLALPTPMALLDAEGRQVMRIVLGGQSFAGIWDEEMQAFLKMDAGYREVIIEDADPAYSLNVPDVKIRYDFAQDEQGLWSGPAFITLTRPSLDIGRSQVALSAGAVQAQYTLQQYDPKAVKNYREQLIALAAAAATHPTAVGGPPSLGLYNMLTDLIFNTGDGFTSQYSVKDLHLLRPDGTDIAVKAGTFGHDMTGFAKERVRLGLQLGYEGYSMTPALPGYKDIQPSGANLDLVMENLPFRELLQVLQNTFKDSFGKPDIAKLAGLSLMLKLPAILAQSGAYLTVKDNFIANDQYRVDLNGSARADMAAANSVTGEFRAVFRGLDKLLAKAQMLAGDERSLHKQKFRQLAGTLETIKQVAKVETDTTNGGNEFVHVLEISMNAQGDLLVNDKDLFTLMKERNTPAPAPVTPP